MCLAVVAFDVHPRYALVVAANRDEHHARPTAAAAWWPEGLLAGRDLAAGGTWLGVTRGGRFALLTNVRNPAQNDPAAPSRGGLVPAVLRDPATIAAALAHVRATTAKHNGFNLVAGDPTAVAWTSNRDRGVRELAPGVHGISNGLLDDDWPKVRRTRAAMSAWVASGEIAIEPLLVALADRAIAPDAELPATGIDRERERALSAVFILGESYGTRCSTVVALGRDGEAIFVERSFAADGQASGEIVQRFAWAAQRNVRSIAM